MGCLILYIPSWRVRACVPSGQHQLPGLPVKAAAVCSVRRRCPRPTQARLCKSLWAVAVCEDAAELLLRAQRRPATVCSRFVRMHLRLPVRRQACRQ